MLFKELQKSNILNWAKTSEECNSKKYTVNNRF